ncbi:MAG: hypothetical protein JRE65_10675 [Deltaproteobacteria bacterium]|jgi:hypothetical protein|nr:hypothetical protein [Deltaproteobacteria bacterium]
MVLNKQNCWEYMKCGREPEGDKVADLGICRAATDEFFNGMNGGKNGGRICFSIAETFSDDEIQFPCNEKLASCKNCGFFKSL